MEHTVCKQILDQNEALLSATCNTKQHTYHLLLLNEALLSATRNMKRHAYPLLLHAVPVLVCELALAYH